MGIERLRTMMGVREVARATANLAKRKLSGVEIHSATVRSAVPGSGLVTVHIEGDAPGDATIIASATGDFYAVGERVLVAFFPTSGATIIGYADPIGPWQPYPSDFTPWSSSNRKVPTVTDLTAFTSINGYPGSLSSFTSASINLPASRLIVVVVGAMEMTSSTVSNITSITNTGVPLVWTRGHHRHDNMTTSSVFAPFEANHEIWWAYNTSAQTGITITATYDRAFIPVPLNAVALSITDALPLQTTGATGGATTIATSSVTTNLTTLIDHSVVLASVLYTEYTGGALGNLAPSAAASNTLILGNPAFATAEFRSAAITRRATTTVASTTVGATMGSAPPASEQKGSIAAMEIVGVPDVPVIGDGSVHAASRLRGKTLDLRLDVVAGAGTTFGGGPLAFLLPPAMVASPLAIGGRQGIGGSMLVGSNEYPVRAVILAGASSFSKILYQGGSAQFLDATHPAPLGATFRLELGGRIEIA